MKRIIRLAVSALLLVACNQTSDEEELSQQATATISALSSEKQAKLADAEAEALESVHDHLSRRLQELEQEQAGHDVILRFRNEANRIAGKATTLREKARQLRKAR